MFALTIFAIATLFFFLRSKFGNENEEILTMTTYIIGVGTAIVFLLLFFDKEEPTIDLMYLGFIPFFLFGIHYIKKKTKATDISVIANQQRYFNEVRGTDIYDFYKTRKSVKKNRVETLVNKYSKKLIKDDTIVPSFFLDFKDFTPTKVESITDLQSSAVYSAVLKKIKGFADDREISFDYEQELKNNDNCVEFFLMDLYERLTSPFNISVANLDILAKNDQEIELLGALDLINLNSVKRKGAVLYYKFIEFKSRIGDFIKQEVSSVSPVEEGFDEEYAKDLGE